MSEESKVRLGIINETLGSDENIHIETLALLFDPGGGLEKREAEGHLVLTDRRLIFGTARHGILVDATRNQIQTPVSFRFKWMMARLTIEDETGIGRIFVVSKSAARDIASALNKWESS